MILILTIGLYLQMHLDMRCAKQINFSNCVYEDLWNAPYYKRMEHANT